MGLKTFFDGIFVDNQTLKDAGLDYQIKLEYYKTIAEKENVEAKFGIEIVQTEYKKGYTNVESEKIENITGDAEEINNILNIFRDNEVTPVGMQDVLDENFKKLKNVL